MKFIRNLLGIILGVATIVLGFYCLFNPAIPFMTLGYMVGVSMLFDGFAEIYMYFQQKKLDMEESVWTLIGGILSLVCGFIIIGDAATQMAINIFIVYFAASWIVLRGIISIIIALKVRSLHKEYNTVFLGSKWWHRLLLGILNIVFGCICFSNPDVMVAYIGIYMGFGIISTGFDMIALVEQVNHYEKIESEIQDRINTVRSAVNNAITETQDTDNQ